MLEIVKELVKIRKAKKLTQSEVAHRLGIPQSSVGRVEIGSVDAKVSRFIDLAKVLDHEVILVPKERLREVRAILQDEKQKKEVDPSKKPKWSTSFVYQNLNPYEKLLKENEELQRELKRLSKNPFSVDDNE